ncbi:MAG: hypothetical protein LBC44_02855 [Mycoplasmataceae bacterium]|jgi:hypothetical protein|nr:hypothetical protein [Mycoplasmataceae bacterium]
MSRKNLKLTLATLFGGIGILSCGAAFSLTSCNDNNNNDTTVVLNSTSEAEQYLNNHKHYLNSSTNAEDKVIQNGNLADDDVFNKFLNVNLDIQNIANAIVQLHSHSLDMKTGSTNKLSIKVEKNHLLATYQNIRITSPQVVTTTIYNLTLVKGSVDSETDVLTKAKLSGVISKQVDDEEIQELFNSENGVSLISAALVTYEDKQEYTMEGTYNTIVFGDANANPLYNFVLSGEVEVNTNVDNALEYTSTLDTQNVQFKMAEAEAEDNQEPEPQV